MQRGIRKRDLLYMTCIKYLTVQIGGVIDVGRNGAVGCHGYDFPYWQCVDWQGWMLKDTHT